VKILRRTRLRKGAMVWRRGKHADVRVQVVAPLPGVHIVAARHARLQGDRVAHLCQVHKLLWLTAQKLEYGKDCQLLLEMCT
jgi:hypothetical protein